MKKGWLGLVVYVFIIFCCYLLVASGKLGEAVDLLKIALVVSALIAGLMLTKPSR